MSFSDQLPSVLTQSSQPQTFPSNTELLLLLSAGYVPSKVDVSFVDGIQLEYIL